MICDASPLILFAKAGHLELLWRVLGDCVVPEPVWREVQAGQDDARLLKQCQVDGRIEVVEIDDAHLASVHPGLGRGELGAISLAIQRGEALVLMDDRLGRAAAKMHQIRPVGCLGVLLRAHKQGVAVRPVFDALIQAGLWLAPEVIINFLDALEGD